MKLDIEGRVALVVGASRGIGFAIADTLAAEGAKVAMAARGLDGLKSAAGQDRPRRLVPCRRRHRSRRRAVAGERCRKAMGQDRHSRLQRRQRRFRAAGQGNRRRVVAGDGYQPVRRHQYDRSCAASDEPRQRRPRDRLRVVDLRARRARRAGDLFGGEGGTECDRARPCPAAGARRHPHQRRCPRQHPVRRRHLGAQDRRKQSPPWTRCSRAKCRCAGSASPKKSPTSSPFSPPPAPRSSRAP